LQKQASHFSPRLPTHKKNTEHQDSVDPALDNLMQEDVLADIQDGVVAECTLVSYINDNLAFLWWFISSGGEYDCLMDDGRQAILNTRTHHVNELTCAFNACVHSDFKALLQNAHVNPIVFIDQITPECYMHSVLSLCHPLHGDQLSKSSYSNKHAGLNHLF